MACRRRYSSTTGSLPGARPAGLKTGRKPRFPGKVVGAEIDEHEQRRFGRRLRHQAQGLVVEETVGLDIPGAEVVRVVEMLDAGGLLEAARAHEPAKGRIERDGVVAAAAQRQR